MTAVPGDGGSIQYGIGNPDCHGRRDIWVAKATPAIPDPLGRRLSLGRFSDKLPSREFTRGSPHLT